MTDSPDTAVCIRSFSTLQRGWDYGAGGPVSRRVIEDALFWNQFLIEHGILDTEAAPTSRCGVLISATVGGLYTEVITEPRGAVTITQDRRPLPPLYRRKLSRATAQSLLLELMASPSLKSVGLEGWTYDD